MSHGDALSLSEHETRSADHAIVARALHSAAQEPWAAVPYFYAAYHLMKAAFISDSIFDDPTRLSAIPGCPAMSDRGATRHHGYMQQQGGSRVRVWGVNDLVAALYKPAWPSYSQLHEASCDIRYGRGLRVPLAKLSEAYDQIENDYNSHALVAP